MGLTSFLNPRTSHLLQMPELPAPHCHLSTTLVLSNQRPSGYARHSLTFTLNVFSFTHLHLVSLLTHAIIHTFSPSHFTLNVTPSLTPFPPLSHRYPLSHTVSPSLTPFPPLSHRFPLSLTISPSLTPFLPLSHHFHTSQVNFNPIVPGSAAGRVMRGMRQVANVTIVDDDAGTSHIVSFVSA